VFCFSIKGILVHSRLDESDVVVFALGENLAWTRRVFIDDPLYAKGCALQDTVATASKLELLVCLLREGWAWKTYRSEPITIDGERAISLNMMLRSKKYLEALCSCEHLFR
jgi:hypothetical protein